MGRGIVTTKYHHIAPRIGFAWDPFGDGKTAIRAGAGIFYGTTSGNEWNQPGNANPYAVRQTFGSVNSMSNPYATTMVNGSASSFPSGDPFPYTFNPKSPRFLLPASIESLGTKVQWPYIYQFNLSLQQQLANNLTLEAGYVGYLAHGLTGLTDINAFAPGSNTRVLDLQACCAGDYNFMNTFENIGMANYNALQTTLTKRMSSSSFGETFFMLAYTWSHEIDNESGYRQRNSFVPYYNHEQFRSSGDFDLRNVISLSGGWELPFDKLWEKGPSKLTKGWNLYPIVSYRSGFPLDVMAFPGVGPSQTSPGPSGAGDPQVVRADLVAPVTYYDPHGYQTIQSATAGAQTGNYYFNPNSFSNARAVAINNELLNGVDPSTLVSSFTYGTLGRNILRGPGRINTDVALSKHFRLFGEKLDAELRADAFNISTTRNSATRTPTSAIRASARSRVHPIRAFCSWRCT